MCGYCVCTQKSEAVRQNIRFLLLLLCRQKIAHANKSDFFQSSTCGINKNSPLNSPNYNDFESFNLVRFMTANQKCYGLRLANYVYRIECVYVSSSVCCSDAKKSHWRQQCATFRHIFFSVARSLLSVF